MLRDLGIEMASYDSQLFMVLDGATTDNIMEFLESNFSSYRSLFRLSAPKDIMLAGPWLVPVPPKPKVLDEHLRLASDYGGAVFWVCSQGEKAMYDHLRRLNAAELDQGRVVFFRHFDPDVLGSIVPMLDAEQASQLFGPAVCIGLVGGRANGASVSKPDGLPPAATGPIAFHDWQIEKLDERQWGISRKRVAAMLREDLPQQTQHLSDAELDKAILSAQDDARSRNLSTELSLARWSYLDLLSAGQVRRRIPQSRLSQMADAQSGHLLSPDQALHQEFETIKHVLVAQRQ